MIDHLKTYWAYYLFLAAIVYWVYLEYVRSERNRLKSLVNEYMRNVIREYLLANPDIEQSGNHHSDKDGLTCIYICHFNDGRKLLFEIDSTSGYDLQTLRWIDDNVKNGSIIHKSRIEIWNNKPLILR